MKEGKIQIFTGDGRGKSPAALGMALQSAVKGERVVVIQFLKGRGLQESPFSSRLEPELKLFRFEKSAEDFNSLSEEKRREEWQNIRNGLNYARKVLVSGQCDMLVLDEVLALIDNSIITEEELIAVLEARNEETDVILTGAALPDKICQMADNVTRMETVKAAR